MKQPKSKLITLEAMDETYEAIFWNNLEQIIQNQTNYGTQQMNYYTGFFGIHIDIHFNSDKVKTRMEVISWNEELVSLRLWSRSFWRLSLIHI